MTRITQAEHFENSITAATDEVIEYYQLLAEPEWTSDDCSPLDLLCAVNDLRELTGDHPIDDFAEACDWAAYLVSLRALNSDDITQREHDHQVALTRDDDEDDEDSIDERAADYRYECAHGQNPIPCLDTFRMYDLIVEYRRQP